MGGWYCRSRVLWLEGSCACQGGGRACESAPEVGHTRKLHVSGCHTCMGVELGRLDIVTALVPSEPGASQRPAATGDSSAMDLPINGVEVDEASNVY